MKRAFWNVFPSHRTAAYVSLCYGSKIITLKDSCSGAGAGALPARSLPAPGPLPCDESHLAHLDTRPRRYLMFSSAAFQAGVPSAQDTAGPVSVPSRTLVGPQCRSRTPFVACDHGTEVVLAPCTPSSQPYHARGPQNKTPDLSSGRCLLTSYASSLCSGNLRELKTGEGT